ncbi:hypothetical protein PanWU01x14_266120 [Parasponia andersonii]|uniref:Uncharacterized protein n=1 Tax=Parasponia andersonii TaxID=3476 RepID=A0A2P5B6V1_PARAD|nr:hypothetical protein PanWU01x14_266120 [Parasponia andersonii]
MDRTVRLYHLSSKTNHLVTDSNHHLPGDQQSLRRLACTNSKEEDKGTLCCRTYIRDVKPRPLDLSNTYQQFEIIRKKYRGFYANSVAPNGHPPHFLRRKYWGINMRTTPLLLRGISGPQLFPSCPSREPNLSLSNPSSQPNIAVGKWYSSFVFVKEGHVEPNDQMKISTFYKITLEQRRDKIFGCQIRSKWE